MSNVAERASAPGAVTGSARVATLAGLAAILVAAGYLRLHDLGADSFWRDEAASWMQAHGSIADIVRVTAADNYPPLHNFLLAIAMGIGGDSEWVLRLPSAILGVLSIAAIYWVGVLVSGRVAGLLAALLLALSPFAIHYSQEARPYALLLFAALIFAGSAISFERRPSAGWSAAAFLSGVALLYTHPYGAFTWVAIAGTEFFALVSRRADGTRPLLWLSVQIAVAIAYVPWALILAGRANAIAENGFWIPYPGFDFVLDSLEHVTSGAAPLTLLLPAAAVAFVAPRASPSCLAVRAPSTAAWLLLAWLLVPIALGVAVSMVRTPIFYDRYIIASLPPFLLIAAIGLSRFVGSPTSGALVAAFALAVAALGYFHGAPGPREDWRSAAAYVAANLPPDGCVLLVDKQGKAALDYYYRKPYRALYPKDMASTTAGTVLAVRAGNVAALDPALTSPAWRAGSGAQFNLVEVVPLTHLAP